MSVHLCDFLLPVSTLTPVGVARGAQAVWPVHVRRCTNMTGSFLVYESQGDAIMIQLTYALAAIGDQLPLPLHVRYSAASRSCARSWPTRTCTTLHLWRRVPNCASVLLSYCSIHSCALVSSKVHSIHLSDINILMQWARRCRVTYDEQDH